MTVDFPKNLGHNNNMQTSFTEVQLIHGPEKEVALLIIFLLLPRSRYGSNSGTCTCWRREARSGEVSYIVILSVQYRI